MVLSEKSTKFGLLDIKNDNIISRNCDFFQEIIELVLYFVNLLFEFSIKRFFD